MQGERFGGTPVGKGKEEMKGQRQQRGQKEDTGPQGTHFIVPAPGVAINSGPEDQGPGTRGPEDRGPEDQGPEDPRT